MQAPGFASDFYREYEAILKTLDELCEQARRDPTIASHWAECLKAFAEELREDMGRHCSTLH